MTQSSTRYTTATRRLSEDTRVVQSVLRMVEGCSCGQTPRILMLRGVDGSSRNQARVMSRRIQDRRTDATIVVQTAAQGPGVDPRHGHYCASLDTRPGQISQALLGFRWEPNQPDTGLLQVALDGVDLPMPAGAGLEIRMCGEGLGVWAIEDNHQRATRLGPSAAMVEVSQVDGLHLMYRDEILEGDSPAQVIVAFDEMGGMRRVH